jgi:hypothetical protein
VAQPGSAPALGAGSRRFKSSRPDHNNINMLYAFRTIVLERANCLDPLHEPPAGKKIKPFIRHQISAQERSQQ